ncbi:MAG TPA: metallophosphoesterase [Clostridiales bacterium]|jgi:putative phosphoesterase|nr:metallophosphoesterase [Clostridiales bacterium]
MKILIVSDTHGKNDNYKEVLKRVSPIDLVIHLGDFEGGVDYIRSITPCPIELVSGNNDFFYRLPKEKILNIGKYKVMLSHGHRYGVNFNTNHIRETAIINNVDIVMFGHTHVPMINLSGDVWIVNPGSLAYPRQEERIPTFIIMDFDDHGDAHFTLNYLN